MAKKAKEYKVSEKVVENKNETLQKFLGKKQVLAKPMTRKEYNDYRGWQLPKEENGEDEGMLVEYVDGGTKNHEAHEGYISWSPKEVFENSYSLIETPLQRLVIEERELGEKCEALDKALNSENFSAKVGQWQFEQMKLQYNHMISYRRILNKRIRNLNA
jgi:hypothetical protein